jgi:hypothetical protein
MNKKYGISMGIESYEDIEKFKMLGDMRY